MLQPDFNELFFWFSCVSALCCLVSFLISFLVKPLCNSYVYHHVSSGTIVSDLGILSLPQPVPSLSFLDGVTFAGPSSISSSSEVLVPWNIVFSSSWFAAGITPWVTQQQGSLCPGNMTKIPLVGTLVPFASKAPKKPPIQSNSKTQPTIWFFATKYHTYIPYSSETWKKAAFRVAEIFTYV